jgi:hypothetical protein
MVKRRLTMPHTGHGLVPGTEKERKPTMEKVVCGSNEKDLTVA